MFGCYATRDVAALIIPTPYAKILLKNKAQTFINRAFMTQEIPSEKNLVQDYIKACGYGVNPPNSLVRLPIVKTGNIVQDYLAAAGYGLYQRNQKSSSTRFDS